MRRPRPLIANPIRARIVELIDECVEDAQAYIQRANDLSDLLNALDNDETIRIEGNVVMGAFKKKKDSK